MSLLIHFTEDNEIRVGLLRTCFYQSWSVLLFLVVKYRIIFYRYRSVDGQTVEALSRRKHEYKWIVPLREQ